MKCNICSYEIASIKGLATHVKTKHSETTYEEYYLLTNDKKTCVICNSPVPFISIAKGYKEVCTDCKSSKEYKEYKKLKKLKNIINQYGSEENYYKHRESIRKQNTLEKYGVSHTSKLDKTKHTMIETCKKTNSYSKRAEKTKQTNLERYGVENVQQVKEIKERSIKTGKTNNSYKKGTVKAKKTNLEKYGDSNYNNIDQTKQTNLERYGVPYVFQSKEFKEQSVKTCLEKYGVSHSTASKEVIDKIQNTMRLRYGKRSFFYTDSYITIMENKFGSKYPLANDLILEKSNNTKKRNNSFATSKIEETVYELLKEKYDIDRQYKSEEYPYRSDFYIKEKDLYIEVQGNWTHGSEAFFNNKDQQERLNKLTKNSETSKYYANALHNWTVTDVKKRNSKALVLELFNFTNIFRQIDLLENIDISYSESKLKKELNYFKNKSGNINAIPNKNKIVYHYQNSFFKKENELYKDNNIRRKLIQNRMKYLNKEEHEITNLELLTGFKKSGIHYGFSHFSPLWLKYYLDKYEIQTTTDYFGGWGHRLLASQHLEKYTYIDISKIVSDSVLLMINELNINNCLVINNDARNVSVKSDLSIMSPPYDNLEKYENEVDDFKELIRSVKNNLDSKYVLVFILEEYRYLFDDIGEVIEENYYNCKKSHFNKTRKEISILYKKD